MSNRIPFLLRTAWRDSRKERGKLILFMSSIILGISALVAINSFHYNVLRDIDQSAAALLGADIVLESNQPMVAKVKLSMDSIEAESATERELFSMALFPKANSTQFVRVKGIEGRFPFYGQLKTIPENAAQTFRITNGALVDESLLFQYGLEVGDSIKLGETTLPIEGRLLSSFGGGGASTQFAPPVYITANALDSTKLIRPGSFVDYLYYYKVAEDFNAEQWRTTHRSDFREVSTRIETIQTQKEDIGEIFDNLNYFLNLVALVALLLGCIGVASSVFIYVKRKINSIAIFRCLGMKGNDAFFIYFTQIIVLGLIGALLGSMLGSAIQLLIPEVLSGFLPMEVKSELSFRAIGEGMSIGLLITLLFALIPLVTIRRVSPLRSIRASFDKDLADRDPVRWFVYLGIVGVLLLYLWMLTNEWFLAIVFTTALLVSFLVLFGAAQLLIWLVKRFFPKRWSFVYRQGLANLFRPNNQTRTLLMSIGLGTGILTTLFIMQSLILHNVQQIEEGNQPNMILFGIERTQGQALADLTKSFEMPILQQVPIVTMKVAGWQGRTKEEWMADTSRTARSWVINRENRVTYRDTLKESETLIRGEWIGEVNPGDSIFISLAEGFANSLDVDLGDEVLFNVQGALLTTYVGSIREVDFERFETNFLVLFPKGVLEEAPQFQVLITKSPDAQTTAAYRGMVVKLMPNVSVIDLTSIVESINKILAKVSFVVQFMAAFSIFTGLIVLISSLLLSKFQRIRESVLLRTIGASKRQIWLVNGTEYAFIGGLSAFAGIGLSILFSYLIARFEFEFEYTVPWLEIILIFIIVVALTVFIGILNTREVVQKSPLEVLRKEVE